MHNALSKIAARGGRASRQQGVAAVEFAVIMFVLFLIGAGVVEFGRAFWYYNAMLKGTRDAARYLTAVPTMNLPSAGTTARQIVVRAATSGGVPAFSSANVDISCAPVLCSAAVMPSDIRSVTVRTQYDLGIGSVFPFIGGGGAATVTLSPQTTMPYLW
jgi:Flp pilus assembly protein TadG